MRDDRETTDPNGKDEDSWKKKEGGRRRNTQGNGQESGRGEGKKERGPDQREQESPKP